MFLPDLERLSIQYSSSTQIQIKSLLIVSVCPSFFQGHGGGQVPVPVWLFPLEQRIRADTKREQALLSSTDSRPGENRQLHPL